MPSTTREERARRPDEREAEPTPLPTPKELNDAVYEDLSDAIQTFCHIRWQVWRVATFHGEQAPTFEDIGRLFSFLVDVDGATEELRHYIEDIRKDIERLDYVRLNENVDPDADLREGDDA